MVGRFLLSTLVLVWTCRAQTPVITMDTPASTATLQQWLHSGDPRLVAWAATFAIRTHDIAVVDEMPALLETWTLPSIYARGEDNAAHRRAAMAMLDALIVQNAAVTPSTLEAIGEAMPAQALILAARMPANDARGLLIRWATNRHGGGWNGETLARVATMLLSKSIADSPSTADFWQPAHVATVVAASEEHLEIHVRASSSGLGRGGSGGCGDSMSRPITLGWPEVYTYELSERQTAGSETTLVSLDGDVIGWRRQKENGGGGSCNGVEPLNPVTRHRLLAYWTGVTVREMAWFPEEQREIIWHNQADYLMQLGQIVESERGKLLGTVNILRSRGLLTETEAPTLTPALRVTVLCDMTPCPLR